MEAKNIEEDFEDFSEKEQVCYILCGRKDEADCKEDMGVLCQIYQKSFEELYKEEELDKEDPNDWDEAEQEEEEEEEGLFEIAINNCKNYKDKNHDT